MKAPPILTLLKKSPPIFLPHRRKKKKQQSTFSATARTAVYTLGRRSHLDIAKKHQRLDHDFLVVP